MKNKTLFLIIGAWLIVCLVCKYSYLFTSHLIFKHELLSDGTIILLAAILCGLAIAGIIMFIHAIIRGCDYYSYLR